MRDDGGSIRFRHALIRGLLGFLEIYLTFGGLAIGVALFNDKSKRLGDIVAGTYSLRQRVPSTPPRIMPVAPPHHLQAWVAMADIGRVPDATARRAGTFVQQAYLMAPASRVNMAASLASELARYVAPPPPRPPAPSPEDYIGAVLGGTAQPRTHTTPPSGAAERDRRGNDSGSCRSLTVSAPPLPASPDSAAVTSDPVL